MTVHQEILRRLDAIERDHRVRTVFAIESGSRAWGFASPDSDYDVRFVYVHALEHYLRLQPQRDVIERPIEQTTAAELDVNGWDLRKALQLMLKGNPVLVEWLDSPIVYREAGHARTEFRSVADRYFQPLTCWHHYHSIAKTNYRGYLLGDRVRLKKYFYVLRPLLACRWIEARATLAPMSFHDLIAATSLDPDVARAIDDLLARKTVTAELGDAPRVDVLNRFIEAELHRHDVARHGLRPAPRLDSAAADRFFQSWVSR